MDGEFNARPVVIKEDGSEMIKQNNEGVSTFFPKSWNKGKILEEVEFAIENNYGKIPNKPNGNEYYGYTRDGNFKIHFYLNSNGQINSYFPSMN